METLVMTPPTGGRLVLVLHIGFVVGPVVVVVVVVLRGRGGGRGGGCGGPVSGRPMQDGQATVGPAVRARGPVGLGLERALPLLLLLAAQRLRGLVGLRGQGDTPQTSNEPRHVDTEDKGAGRCSLPPPAVVAWPVVVCRVHAVARVVPPHVPCLSPGAPDRPSPRPAHATTHSIQRVSTAPLTGLSVCVRVRVVVVRV